MSHSSGSMAHSLGQMFDNISFQASGLLHEGVQQVAATTYISFVQDTVALCGVGSYSIDAGSGFSSYLWSTGDSTQTITVSNSGLYSCTVSDNGCFSTDSIYISLLDVSITASDSMVCAGDRVALSAGGGIGAASVSSHPAYLPTNGLVAWYPFNGSANDESGNGNNGTVNGANLTTDRDGNANSAYDFDGVDDSTHISGFFQTISDAFHGVIDDIAIYNRALSASEIQNLYTANASNLTYNWSTDDSTVSITANPIQTTTYYCTVSDGISTCTDSLTVYVQTPPVSGLLQDSIFACPSDSVLLDAGAGSDRYLWNTGDSTSTLTALVSGNYSVTIVQGVCEVHDSVEVHFGHCAIDSISLSLEANLNGLIRTSAFVQAGDIPVIERGIAYALHSFVSLADSIITAGDGNGLYTSNIFGVLPDTSYTIRAYAITARDTFYSAALQVQTPTLCSDSYSLTTSFIGNYEVRFDWTGNAGLYNIWFRALGEPNFSKVNSGTNFKPIRLQPDVYEVYVSEAGNTNPSCTAIVSMACEDYNYLTNVFQIIDATGGKVFVFAIDGGRRLWDIGLDNGEDTTWVNGRFANRFRNLIPGSYTVRVRDAFGCYSSQADSIVILPVDTSQIPVLTTVQRNGSALNINWTMENLANVDRYQIRLIDVTAGGTGFLYNTYIATGQSTSFYQVNNLPDARYRIDVRPRINGSFQGAVYSDYKERIIASGNKTGEKDIQNTPEGLLVEVYPNPVEGRLHIVAPLNAELILTDISGKRVYTGTQEHLESTISMNYFASGTYVLSVRTEKHVENIRVVKR